MCFSVQLERNEISMGDYALIALIGVLGGVAIGIQSPIAGAMGQKSVVRPAA